LTDQAQLLPGTLDLLILKAVSLGPLHGYGILLRIGQISDRALLIEQGALYQIHREDRCWSAQSIRISQNKLAICFGQSGC
jgi:hypothetical protein